MKQMESDVTWLRSTQLWYWYLSVGLPARSSTFQQEYYFISFMSILTTKHDQLCLGKHSPSLGQLKGNPQGPVLREGLLGQVAASEGTGDASARARGSSGTAAGSCGGWGPRWTHPGHALHPQSRPAHFPSLLSCEYWLLGSVTTTTSPLLDQIFFFVPLLSRRHFCSSALSF